MNSKLARLVDEKALLFDGAMGTELYKRHQFLNVCYEELNLKNPALITAIHQEYLDAGAEVITTNSFGANRLKLAAHFLADKSYEINRAAATLARQAAGDKKLVAGSVGPLLSSATKSITAQELTAIFKESISGLLAGGVDFIIFETFTKRSEILAAARAATELAAPYVASMALTESGCSRSGETIEHFFGNWPATLEKPLMLGLNCGLGPKDMLKYLEKLLSIAGDIPVLAEPNTGAPQLINDRLLSLTSPEYLATYASHMLQIGVKAIGGCCGVTPAHIKELAASLKTKQVKSLSILPPAAPELAAELPLARRSAFGAKLARGEWVTSVEITPPVGADLSRFLEKAKLCHEAGIDVINIPDGPRASARCSPLVSAITITKALGQEVVLHLACRDRNIIGMQSDLLGAAAAGLNNILVITGDPPKAGDYPFSSAVFDIDSIGLIGIAHRLNQGLDIGGHPIKPPTTFAIGAGADPNHIDRAKEIDRLKEKIAAGANFVVTQPIFDPKVLADFLTAAAPLEVPVIAGVWPLMNAKNAEFMNNEVPGVKVPEAIIARMHRAKSKEEAHAEGKAIAIEIIKEIRHLVQGVQVSAPLGNTAMAIEVIKATLNG